MPRAAALLGLVVLAGCGGGGGPAGPSATQPSSTPGRLSANRVFDIALVIADPRGLSVAQASAIATQAVATLRSRANLTAALLSPALGSGPGPAAGAQWLAARGLDAPEAVVVFSDDTMARTYGGYASSLTLPAGAPPNEFPAPGQPADRISEPIVDGLHWYARCGYDENLNRVSEVSVGGECRNRPGTPCVPNGAYWMCADATADLYADPAYFNGCTIVHELAHFYGYSSNSLDHYGTPECRARTGMGQTEASDLRLAQLHCTICPDVYSRFPPPRAAASP